MKISEDIFREVNIFKELNHPNIVKYYTSFEEKDKVCIVMELVDGSSLGDFISTLADKKQYLKEKEAWEIIIQLVSALRYLHNDKKVVHRDIAPSNILIDYNMNVKLADFGLAKQWQENKFSQMKTFVGTIVYCRF